MESTTNQATDTAGVAQTQEQNAGGERETQKVTFTPEQQEHIDKLINAQYAKINAKADKRLEEIKEAEKLKNLSIEERTKVELENAQRKIANYEKEQLVNQFKIELTEKGLPSKFADFVAIDNADNAKAALDFLREYKEGVAGEYAAKISQLEEDLRNAKLRGELPKSVSGNPQTPLSGVGGFLNTLIQK